jgi:hypothetical protein
MKLTRPAYYLRKLAKQYNVSLSGLDLRKASDVLTAKELVVEAIIEGEVKAAARAENVRFFQEVQTLQNKYFRFQLSIPINSLNKLSYHYMVKAIAKISTNVQSMSDHSTGLTVSFTSLEEAVEYAIDGYIDSQRTVKPVIATSIMTGTHNDVRLLLGAHYQTILKDNTILIVENNISLAPVGRIIYIRSNLKLLLSNGYRW